MNVEKVKAELLAKGLSTEGKADALRGRLLAAIYEQAEDTEDQHVDCELEKLKLQVEVLEKTKTKRTFSFNDMEDSLKRYNGAELISVDVWINDFEENAELAGWDEKQKLVYAKKLLTGNAKLLLDSSEFIKTWDELQALLIKHFKVKYTSAQVHHRLSTRSKSNDESCEQYVFKMCEIAKMGAVEDESLIVYIIDGIKDMEFNKVILYGCRTIDELKEKLKIYENIKAKAVKAITNYKNTSKFIQIEKKQVITKPGTRDNSRKCFNCGHEGHEAKSCPNKSLGPTCFKCNEVGHIAPKCTNTAVNTKNEKAQTMVIRKTNVYKDVIILNKVVNALIDMGSDITIIREDLYQKLGSPTLEEDKLAVLGFGSAEVEAMGKFKTEVKIDDNQFIMECYVFNKRNMSVEMIVGNDLLLEGVEIRHKQAGVTISLCKDESSKKQIGDIDEENESKWLMTIEINETDALQVHPKYAEVVEEIKRNYNPKKVNETEIKAKIILKDDIPIYQHPRRLAPLEKEIVSNQLKEWLRDGVIRESDSEYASPIVIVKKKNGASRLCVDYRRLNQKIVRDRYPMPIIEDELDKLATAKVFSTLDLKDGFFHVSVDEDSRKYTSFVSHNGQYEFLKVPFGLCISPAIFMRYIVHIFRPFLESGDIVLYMDDIIILAATYNEAELKLRKIIKRAEEFGLRINWKKCQFMVSSVEYLGHIIENGKIKPSNMKVKAVEHFPEPRNSKQIQSFLGLTGYMRKFIPEYSIKARPLSELLKKNVAFVFGPEQKFAFETLKTELCQGPVLDLYQQDAETQLHTDASKYAYAAILMQKSKDDNKFHPVYYMSRKTSPAEENYHSYELEVLAIIEAVKKFRVYLLGIKFIIVTDCKAFKMTMNKKDLVTRVGRWALLLEEYNYEIEHRSGNKMSHVDALSRNPVVMMIEESVVAKIKKAQTDDDNIKTIMEVLKQNPSYKQFLMKGGILYRNLDGIDLLVIPEIMQNEIIRTIHENGHFSARKMMDVINNEFYIPKLIEKIDRCIKNCVKCILVNRKANKKEGFLHSIDKGDMPLTTYHVDYLGPMTATGKQYKHIFTVIDAFTKFVWLYPTKSCTSREAIEKLQFQQKDFGNPERIVSDKGACFTSGEFTTYCKDENIELHLITTGVPRGNGQVENIHRTIINVLTKLTIDEPEKWYKHVSNVQRCLNSTYHRSVGYSPFEVLMGKPMKRKEDIEIAKLLEEERYLNFLDQRGDVRALVKEQITKIQDENQRTYNRNRKKPVVYEEGDFVAIKRTQFGSGLKLLPDYVGPYRVIKAKRNERYDVEKVGSHDGPNRTSTSADLMKIWQDHPRRMVMSGKAV